MMRSFRTYDVFDTCITRLVGEPISAFTVLGNALVAQGLWKGSSEQFAAARVDAESRSRQHVAPREVRFQEIYDELQSAYDLSEVQTAAIAEAELALEKTLLQSVPAIVGELDRARAEGSEIGFISDMYLPNDVLKSWLVELGVLKGNESLWLSSECGVTKGGGGLFELVRASQAENTEHWTHVGDNARSDVAVPNALGIHGRHYTECHLNRNEWVMERESLKTCGLSSIFAGTSRRVRLARDGTTDSALWTLAAGVGAPVIYSFVLWVLEEAQRRSLKKIWFMARDGQVMLPVAQTIARRLGIDVEVGYLYGGRQVVRVASLVSIDDSALDWLTGGAGVMTLQTVLDRVGISVEEVQETALSLGLPVNAPIGWHRLDTLREFMQHPEVAPKILAQAALRRSVVLEYFQHCGLIGDKRCAVVDIGWKGNVLRSIVDLIGVDQAARHTFMYFGSYAHAKGSEKVPKVAFLFDFRYGRRFGTGDDIPSMTTLMEIFCQADHGQVMQISRIGQTFEPVCRPPELENESRWNVQHFQEVVHQFAKICPIEEFRRFPIDLRDTCDRLLRRLAVEPSDDEIALLAPIGFVDDQGGSQPHPFAFGYRLQNLRVAFRTADSAPKLALNWWVAAAVAKTSPTVRWCMRLAAKAGRARALASTGRAQGKPAST